MRNLWKSGVCETGGGEREVAAAPREADSNMQLSRVRLHSAEQFSWQQCTALQSRVKVDRLKLSIAEQSC